MHISRLLFQPVLLGFCLAGWTGLSALAAEKPGMPDLSQDQETCLPTSTANLIVWFGTHGYPKLIVSGDSKDDGYEHTLHAIMRATDARYDLGTRTDAITYGIRKYISDAGYSCDVEYRGLDWTRASSSAIVQDADAAKYGSEKTPSPFTQDWLQENDDPNKGFILLLAYCNFDRASNTFSDALNIGHAVTLVNAEPDMILIHDPAHYNDEPGRKILTPERLTGGSFRLPGYNAPVSGLLLLSGSLLETPPDAGVMLTGAVCITMHPDTIEASTSTPMPAGAPNGTIAGKGSGASAPSSAPGSGSGSPAVRPSSPGTGWAAWLFDLVFKK